MATSALHSWFRSKWARTVTTVLALAALTAGAGCRWPDSLAPTAVFPTQASSAAATVLAPASVSPAASATTPDVATSPAIAVLPTPSPNALPSGYEMQPPTPTTAGGYPAPNNPPTAIVPTPTPIVAATAPAQVVRSVSLDFTRITAIGGNIGAVEANSSYVYSVDASDNLTIYDRSNANHLVEMSHLAVPTNPTIIQVHSGVLYMLGPEQLSLIDVRDVFQPRLLSNIAISISVNANFPPYHHAKLDIEGTEARIASTPSQDVLKLTVIDISNPSRPHLEKETAVEVPGKTIADAEVAGDYVAVATPDGSMPGVDIYDIRDYKSPKQIAHFALEDSYRVWVVARHLFVGTASFRMQGGYFFVDAASLVILDVSNFSNPLRLGVAETVDLPDDLLVEGNIAYLIGSFNGPFVGSYWVQAVNVSKPNQPASLGRFEFDGHFGTAQIAGGYLFVGAGEGGLQVINVQKPNAALLAGYYGMPGTTTSVKVFGDIAYVHTISMGGRGHAIPDELLTMVDIHDPTEPRIMTSFQFSDFDVVGSVLYLPDEKEGLRVMRVSTTAQPQFLSLVHTDSPARAVRVVDGVAYVVADNELTTIGVHSPRSPAVLAHLHIEAQVSHVQIDGQVAYVWGPQTGIYSIDISDPSRPRLLGHYEFTVTKLIDWWTVALHDHIAYVYNNYSGALSPGFQIIDFRNPQKPQLLTEYSALGVVDIAFTSDRAIVAGEIEPFVNGLMVMNIADPQRPAIEEKIYTPRTHTISDIIDGITLIGTKVLIFFEPEMEIVDIIDPTKPQQEYLGDSLASDARFGHALTTRGEYALVAGGMNLGIWQMTP